MKKGVFFEKRMWTPNVLFLNSPFSTQLYNHGYATVFLAISLKTIWYNKTEAINKIHLSPSWRKPITSPSYKETLLPWFLFFFILGVDFFRCVGVVLVSVPQGDDSAERDILLANKVD